MKLWLSSDSDETLDYGLLFADRNSRPPRFIKTSSLTRTFCLLSGRLHDKSRGLYFEQVFNFDITDYAYHMYVYGNRTENCMS